MTTLYDMDAIAKEVGLSRTTVGIHRADGTCPLHGRAMRRKRGGGKKLFAAPEVLSAYRRWLNELEPAVEASPAQKVG